MKLIRNLQRINKGIEIFLIKFGLILAVIFVISAISFTKYYYPEKWIESCGVIIALISLFVMIVIMFMNNQTIEHNTNKQIESFGNETDKQIASFSKETDKQIDSLKELTKLQIESFSEEVKGIILGLKEVAETQNLTTERQIDSFKTQTDNIVDNLRVIVETQKETTANQIENLKRETQNQIDSFKEETNKQLEILLKVYQAQGLLSVLSQKQIEAFKEQTDFIINGLNIVSSNIHYSSEVSKLNTKALAGKMDETESVFNKVTKAAGEIVSDIFDGIGKGINKGVDWFSKLLK